MSESTWVPTPIADTYQSIQKAAAGYVLMPTDDEVLDVAGVGIRRAIDKMNSRTWNWALVYNDITFVAGTQEYQLQTQFKQPRNFALRNTSGADVNRISFKPWGIFLKECQWGFVGQPNFYSVTNANLYGVLRLDLSPNSSFTSIYPTGRLWYYRRVSYPGGDSTSLDVPSEAVRFIQAQAEGYVADRYAVAKAASAYARAEQAYRDIVRDDCHGQQADWE